MNPIIIPQEYNYIAVFLSLSCNLACPYCINLNDPATSRKSISRVARMSGEKWVAGINRIIPGRDDLPVTLQGGEPTLHRDFYEIVNGIDPAIHLDLLTNFMFDVESFIDNIPSQKFTRDAKYAAIRVSYHPGQNDIEDLIAKAHRMKEAGFYVGIYSVAIPQYQAHIEEVQKRCQSEGIDFRLKEYLGFDGTQWYGTYKYPESVLQQEVKYCECKTTELIVGPSGHIYRCHADLYENRSPVGYLLDPEFEIETIYRPCREFGRCNPCDVKVKTNRFQEYGHTSVDIRNVRDLDSTFAMPKDQTPGTRL